VYENSYVFGRRSSQNKIHLIICRYRRLRCNSERGIEGANFGEGGGGERVGKGGGCKVKVTSMGEGSLGTKRREITDLVTERMQLHADVHYNSV